MTEHDTGNNKPEEKKPEGGSPEENKKSKLDYILERKSEQADKYKAELEEYKAKYEEIQKKMEETPKEKKPEVDYTSKEEFENFKREQRVEQFVKENPQFAEFSDTVKEFARTPEGRGLKTKAMFHAVAGDKLLEMGAKQSKEEKPVQNTHKPLTGKDTVDFKNMSSEDFKKVLAKARAQN